MVKIIFSIIMASILLSTILTHIPSQSQSLSECKSLNAFRGLPFFSKAHRSLWPAGKADSTCCENCIRQLQQGFAGQAYTINRTPNRSGQNRCYWHAFQISLSGALNAASRKMVGRNSARSELCQIKCLQSGNCVCEHDGNQNLKTMQVEIY